MTFLKVALLFCALLTDGTICQSGALGGNQTAELVTENQDIVTPNSTGSHANRLTSESSDAAIVSVTSLSFVADTPTTPDTDFSEEKDEVVYQARNLVDVLRQVNITDEEFVTTYQQMLNLTSEIESHFIHQFSNSTVVVYSEVRKDFIHIRNTECPDYQTVEKQIAVCPVKAESIETAYEDGDLKFCRLWQNRKRCLPKPTTSLNCTHRLSAALFNQNYSQEVIFSELCPRKCADLIGSSASCIKLESDLRQHRDNVTYLREKCKLSSHRCETLRNTETCSALRSYIQWKHPGFVQNIQDLCIPKAAEEQSATSQVPAYNRSVIVITNITHWSDAAQSQNGTILQVNQTVAQQPTRSPTTTPSTPRSTVDTPFPTPTERSTQNVTGITPLATTSKPEAPGGKGVSSWRRPYNWVPCAEDEKATGGSVVCSVLTACYLLVGCAFLHVIIAILK